MKTIVWVIIFLVIMTGVFFMLPTPEAKTELEQTKDTNNNVLTLPASGLLSDFNDKSGDQINSTLQTPFIVTTDAMMQGQSTAEIEWLDESCDGGGLLVRGEIKAGFSFPWAGVFLPFSADFDQTLDQVSTSDKTQSIEFMVKGNPGTYQLMVFVLNNMQPMMVPFEVTDQCQLVVIEFVDHPHIDWAKITGVAWSADGSRNKPELAIFSFELDNVKFN